MTCDRCGAQMVEGVNRGRRLGRPFVICHACDAARLEARVRWQAAGIIVAAGIVLWLAAVAVSGCGSVEPQNGGYRPWQGPAPWGAPSWTNDAGQVTP